MDNINIALNATNIIVASIGGLVGIVITHYFTKKRKVDELLFTARKEIYVEFMRSFGMAFGPEKINLEEVTNKTIETEYERTQRINRVFAQCRLVASPLLESKLRHLHGLVESDTKHKNLQEKGKRERDYIGYEIEAIMRYDLHVIGSSELFFWRILSFVKRRWLKKNLVKSC